MKQLHKEKEAVNPVLLAESQIPEGKEFVDHQIYMAINP